MPNLATQVKMRAPTQSSAAMDFNGVASNHHCEQVPEALSRRGKWANQVHMYVGEASLWEQDGLDRSCMLWANLAT